MEGSSSIETPLSVSNSTSFTSLTPAPANYSSDTSVPTLPSSHLDNLDQGNNQNSVKRPLNDDLSGNDNNVQSVGQVGTSQSAAFMADIQKRWKQQKIDQMEPPTKIQRIDRVSDSTEDSLDNITATDERPIAAPPTLKEGDRKTRGKKLPKRGDSDYSNSDDDKPDPPTPKSENDSNYEPSSAPTSDSDDVEFEGEGLSEEANSGDDYKPRKAPKILSKKKMPVISALSFLANNHYKPSDSENEDDERNDDKSDKSDNDHGSQNNKDLCQAKNSFEALRRLRAMREKKKQQESKPNGKFESWTSIDREDSSLPSTPTTNRRRSSVDENNIDRGVTEKYVLARKRQVLLSDDEDTNSNSTSTALVENDAVDRRTSPIMPKSKGLRKTVVYSSSGESDASDKSGDDDEAGEDGNDEQKETRPLFQVSTLKKPSLEELQDMCLHFFNTATTNQLSNLPRCSENSATAIIKLRPFKSYDDLIDKIETIKIKGFSSQVVTSHLQVVEWQNDLDRLLQTCQRIADQLQSSVDELLAGNTATVSQPESLNNEHSLKPYQVLGLNWLILMYRNNLNAVLADEMGLGKTIQVIAFLAYLKEQNIRGPHIVVVPSSTMDNWLHEFRRWCPTLNILTYYGSMEDRKFLRKEIQQGRQKDFDVMLSTYRVITSTADDRSFFKRLNIGYAVFDEAHMLKSYTTARYKSLMKVKAKHRLLLTGTPLQNNLVELVSLLHFVMPTLFRDHTENLKDILNLFQAKNGPFGEYEQEKIEQAKGIMKPLVLRRLKADVLSQLPEKHDRIEICELTDRQTDLYGSLVSEYTTAVTRAANGESGHNESHADAKGMFMQLRKVANHPLLVRNLYTDDKLLKMAKALKKEKARKGVDVQGIFEDLAALNDSQLHAMCKQHRTISGFKLKQADFDDSGKFRVLDRILPEINAQGNKVLLFSQFTMMLDILEEFLKTRKYKYLRLDGSTPVVDRQTMIDKFNATPTLFAFLLSTRAGGLGINLTSANTIILHDIDYNPYNDKQAEDRCHRVGQTKEVTVIKLIARNTVDETMLACAQRKLQLEQQITGVDQEDDEDSRDVESLLKQALKF